MPYDSIAASNAAIAQAAAAQAQAAAHEAHVERCKAELHDYNAQTATVAQMQSYAECVGTVYPDPMSPADVLWIKALIVASIVGGVIGAFRRDPYLDGIGDRLMFAFLGAAIGALAVGTAWLLMQSARLLLS